MTKVTAVNYKEGLKSIVTAGNHQLIADEPKDIGGNDEGVNPHELLAASLATCTAITLRMYINHKNLPIEDIKVDVDVETDKANKTSVFKRQIHIHGHYDESVGKRLLSVANACPIHKILEGSIHITSELNQSV